jgi:chromosome segregation ATPase
LDELERNFHLMNVQHQATIDEKNHLIAKLKAVVRELHSRANTTAQSLISQEELDMLNSELARARSEAAAERERADSAESKLVRVGELHEKEMATILDIQRRSVDATSSSQTERITALTKDLASSNKARAAMENELDSLKSGKRAADRAASEEKMLREELERKVERLIGLCTNRLLAFHARIECDHTGRLTEREPRSSNISN